MGLCWPTSAGVHVADQCDQGIAYVVPPQILCLQKRDPQRVAAGFRPHFNSDGLRFAHPLAASARVSQDLGVPAPAKDVDCCRFASPTLDLASRARGRRWTVTHTLGPGSSPSTARTSSSGRAPLRLPSSFRRRYNRVREPLMTGLAVVRQTGLMRPSGTRSTNDSHRGPQGRHGGTAGPRPHAGNAWLAQHSSLSLDVSS